ncbi:MAG: LLM class F420-dependent oxidoreductase, partial [Dehalococcoidia bacterium]
MKFGIGLPGANPMSASRWDHEAITRGIVEVSKKADALGFDFVSAQDHPVIPEASRSMIGPRWYDAFATLAFVAGMTRRVRLLTSVVVLPYRNPFTVAKTIATLDVLSRGRVIFGVGVGHLRAEFEALGVPYEERGARTSEYIEIIRRLWTEEAVTYEGRFYQCQDVTLDPKPAQRPLPIWVGGNSKAAARRAGTLAEGWTPFQVTPEELRELGGYSRGLAGESGRGDAFAVVSPMPAILRHEDAAPKRTPEEIERRVQAIAGESEFYQKIARRNLERPSVTSTESVLEQIDGAREAGAT